MTINYKKILFTILSLVAIIGYGYFVYASAPLGGYNPGQTLDPDCAPGDVDCIVTLPSGGSITANNGLTATGSNVGLGGTLIQNTTIDQDGYDFSLIKNPETQLYSGSSTPGMGFSGIGFSHFETDISSFIGLMQDLVPVMGFSANTPDGQLLRVLTMGEPSGIELINQLGNDFSELNLYGGVTKLFHRNNSTNTFAGINIYSENGPNTDFSIEFATEAGSYTFPRTDGTANQVLSTDGAGQLSWTTPSGGGSGWGLTGDSGTTAGTNFIGTTDPTDFMVKTNGNQIALFGQNGNVAVGSSNIGLGLSAPSAIGDNSIAFGIGNTALGIASTVGGYSSTASGDGSVAFGGEVTANGSNAVAFGDKSRAIADGSTAFGLSTTASGLKSTVFGVSSISSGDESIAIGSHLLSRSFGEVSLGISNVDYLPLNINAFNQFDRSFSIGNGGGSPHNAYTLWKDGSFAYNDDNFQNDNPGTEQNMFYFNYGNHDGLGGVNTKRAIRLGSTLNDEWDINSTNVGNKSISLGFVNDYDGFPTSIASGQNSITIGDANIASEQGAIAIGSAATADGVYSIAIGQGSHASSLTSTALGYGSFASGNRSISLGDNAKAVSANEVSLGMNNTSYVPISIGTWQGLDRLISIGNGDGSFVPTSDAFTILKNGETGIGIDNFETYTNGSIFQVGDGGTNIIGYVDNSTGNWVNVSDERKKENITDLSYGLNEVLQLRPTSFNYKRNGEHTIGFLAQQVLPIIPEAVYGTESEGYGMSYTTLTPVLVKAIQEMNLKITDIGNTETPNTWRDALIAWFESTTNGIRKLFVGEVHTDTLCIGQTCVTESQLQQLLQNNQQVIIPSSSGNQPSDSDPISTSDDTVVPPDTTELVIDSNPVSDTGSNTTDSGDTPTE